MLLPQNYRRAPAPQSGVCFAGNDRKIGTYPFCERQRITNSTNNGSFSIKYSKNNSQQTSIQNDYLTVVKSQNQTANPKSNNRANHAILVAHRNEVQIAYKQQQKNTAQVRNALVSAQVVKTNKKRDQNQNYLIYNYKQYKKEL
ncbi:Hypothetical_protein [Hexamita inflata]|uniref:Hypothetical_protein n=1 Tax=Hexamita inflata TaxID=28002 RepID=A0AA86Q029_9EUKA|nr:Hypothetical protein HINF_LOCUS34977 [Hexamita inflata]